MVISGVILKSLAAVSLASSSYVSGALPRWLGLGQACGQSLLLSLVLCFGGGVLFATSIIHVLPEARSELPDEADSIFCLGFVLLYVIDELIKLCEGEEKSNCKLEVEGLLDRTIHHRYGSVCEHEHQENQDEELAREEPEMTVKVDTKKNNRIGLLVAFSVHSIIEGLVIGVQPVPAKVLLLLGAVSSHKLVVAFCLGAELASDGRSFLSLSRSMLIYSLCPRCCFSWAQCLLTSWWLHSVLLLLGAVSSHKLVVAFCLGAELASDGRSFLSLSRSMLIYSLGSSLGIVLGMLIDQKKSKSKVSIPVLQALAAGSLLYVTVSEVLPRERSRWEHQSRPYAGLAQLISFSLGFLVILSLVVFT
ncbi:zinc transporter ZIP1-like [Macrosteles quadrilineatus]|uniref:zinc transporter ZIP1-like n=1 Tax=Macrosteles quadrilineatus TaxID=74068 RepID=UPI0023E28C44|nr:zinc transporter ZIP1-like [Macrosteles quadrilineatus]